MASVNKTNRVALGGVGLGVIILLLWTYCGRMEGGQDSAITKAPEPSEVPVEEFDASVSEESVMAPVAVVAPVIAEPVVEPAPIEEPVEDVPVAPVPLAVASAVSSPTPVVEAAVPVAAAPALVADTSVARPAPELPAVSAAPPPRQDLLIAKSSAKRFTPDVAALAANGLSVGVPIQGDENSLNVLQPCDTPASACGSGADPGQVVGGANDWTGFVLPGF